MRLSTISKMKRSIACIVALAFIGILISTPATAAIKAGDICKTKGLIGSSPTKKFTCIKLGKKLVWNQGVLRTDQVSTSKVGDICTLGTQPPLKLPTSVLFCVKQGDGKSRFIEFLAQSPRITNPTSPSLLSTCQPPDLRGGIAEGSFNWAITYPAGPVTLANKGTLKIAVVPIDFSDVPGTVPPLTLYGTELKTMASWFNSYSNGKLRIEFQTGERWNRALKTTDYYDVGEGINVNIEGESTREIIQEFVNLTKSNFEYSQSDAVIFLYPENTPNIKNSFAENQPITINSQTKEIFEMSLASANRKYGPAWIWLTHEMLHRMGLAMHFPVNPPNWGIEWGGFTTTPVLLPWNQGILDWINSDQYYCIKKEDLVNEKLTLLPLEIPGAGLHSAFIRISNSEVMMVVSHRKGEWSRDATDSFYGSMVAIIDTTKQTSWNGEHSGEDKMDGSIFPKSGVYLHPDRNFATPRVWTRTETGDWGALMYLGDSVSYKGVVVKLIASNNYDTLQISKN